MLMFRTPVPRAFMWRKFTVRQTGVNAGYPGSQFILLWEMDKAPTCWGSLWMTYNDAWKPGPHDPFRNHQPSFPGAKWRFGGGKEAAGPHPQMEQTADQMKFSQH